MVILRRISLALIIIGAINWGLIGFFNFDLVAFVFNGQQSVLSRFIYALVGLSGLYALTIFFTDIDSIDDSTEENINPPHYSTEFSDEFNNSVKKDIHDKERN